MTLREARSYAAAHHRHNGPPHFQAFSEPESDSGTA